MDEKKEPRLRGSRHDEAEASPGFLFWKAFNKWSRQIRAELEALDLTQVQYSILAATSYLSSAQDHVSQQDVANQLSMDKMMVSDVLKILERKKLIIRKTNPDDRRSFCLQLTSSARRRLEEAVPVVETADTRFFAVLTTEQLRDFARSLAKLGS